MLRLSSALVTAALLLLAFTPPAFAVAPKITIAYVSHMADIEDPDGFSTYSALASLMRELQKNGEKVILFHGGNVLGPSALSSYDKGAHIIGLLNILQPDVMALGRRDFIHKDDELALRSSEAIFPIICSNVYDPISLEPPGTSLRSLIIRRPVPLGFLALVSPEMQTTYIQRRLVSTGGVELLPGLAADLRSEGARFVVGSADYMPDDLEGALQDSGLDLLFISEARETSFSVRRGRGLGLYKGGSGEVLLVRLVGNGQGGLKFAGHKIVRLKDYKPDQEMDFMVQRYAELFSGLTRVEVGTVLTALDTRTDVLRGGENAMGNLIADAMRDYYRADAALINSGGIRGNRVYPADTVFSRGDLQRELPLHDMSCLINVQGSTLLAALEHGLAQPEEAGGRFLQVSGLRVSYDPAAPPGARVQSVSVGDAPLEPGKVYSLSLPEYLNNHGDGFYMFPGECQSRGGRPQQELMEIVRVYLSLHSPMSPRVEGRIKAVGERRGNER